MWTLRHICHWISQKPLEIEAWFQKTTNRKWQRETEWHDPNMLRVQYRVNSWKCYLATIANYCIVCCEAVRLAILATASLFVCLLSVVMWPSLVGHIKCCMPSIWLSANHSIRLSRVWFTLNRKAADLMTLNNPVGHYSNWTSDTESTDWQSAAWYKGEKIYLLTTKRIFW